MLQKRYFTVLLLGGMVQACATAPATTAARETREQTAERPDSNELICREVAGTGWRLGAQRECKTAAEWGDVAYDAQERMPDQRD